MNSTSSASAKGRIADTARFVRRGWFSGILEERLSGSTSNRLMHVPLNGDGIPDRDGHQVFASFQRT
jgi:hypothetical protein